MNVFAKRLKKLLNNWRSAIQLLVTFATFCVSTAGNLNRMVLVCYLSRFVVLSQLRHLDDVYGFSWIIVWRFVGRPKPWEFRDRTAQPRERKKWTKTKRGGKEKQTGRLCKKFLQFNGILWLVLNASLRCTDLVHGARIAYRHSCKNHNYILFFKNFRPSRFVYNYG